MYREEKNDKNNQLNGHTSETFVFAFIYVSLVHKIPATMTQLFFLCCRKRWLHSAVLPMHFDPVSAKFHSVNEPLSTLCALACTGRKNDKNKQLNGHTLSTFVFAFIHVSFVHKIPASMTHTAVAFLSVLPEEMAT